MCGIGGIAQLDGGLGTEAGHVSAMLEAQLHRGPDDEGTAIDELVALGANRLSILDVGPRGHMPMANDTADTWIVFNGEVYNYRELRSELEAHGCTFRSGTDTEVVLRGYEAHGDAFIDQLNGMFAFSIWDRRQRRLLMVRDRLGIKPLYYHWDGRRLSFASEIKALLRLPWVPRVADEASIGAYAARMLVPGERTFFRGVVKAMPGERLVLDEQGLTRTKYWSLPAPGRESDPIPTTDALRALLVDGVRLQMRSDVPLGAYLSGGLDSSLVATIASEEVGGVTTFSAAFDEGTSYDERPWVTIARRSVRGPHHELVIGPGDWWRACLRMAWHVDEPAGGPSVVAQYLISRLAASEVKVALGGQGGDEVFAGYYRHLRARLRDDLQRLSGLWSVAHAVPYLARLTAELGIGNVREKFARAARLRELLRPEFRDWAERGGNHAAPPATMAGRLDALLRQDLSDYLPSLLQVEDRASMAASLESRVPLLDHRLVESVLPIPGPVKLRGYRLKDLERRIAKPILPREIVERRDKRGFPAPIAPWFRGALTDRLRGVLDADDVDRHGVFDRTALRIALDDHVAGRRDNAILLWMALSVELWHATFMDRDGTSYVGA